MLANAERVRATRRRLTEELARLGFAVVPSQANFVWATSAKKPHKEIYEALKQRQILVRYMRFPDVPAAPDGVVTGLRISIGTDAEIDTLLAALREIV
jgi:histidinol-phosphate aminotransferase